MKIELGNQRINMFYYKIDGYYNDTFRGKLSDGYIDFTFYVSGGGIELYKTLFLKGFDLYEKGSLYNESLYLCRLNNMEEIELFRECICMVFRKSYNYVNKKYLEDFFNET